MIYRFRIILDANDDVFRDIEIEASASLEELHNSITQAFGFEGQEMASFYVGNDLWEQGEEIALFDMSETPGGIRIMHETIVDSVTSEDQTKLIYVYDFLNLWTFLVELAEVADREEGKSYPNLMFSHGEIPDEAPEKEFIADNDDEDSDEYGMDAEDYEDLDFDENWN
ncbi:MAG: hypothetical protein JKY22_07705 [Flavobacteriaceae bacterium]|nr:hypothetical protein [Flavobacteriaceae bacterium]